MLYQLSYIGLLHTRERHPLPRLFILPVRLGISKRLLLAPGVFISMSTSKNLPARERPSPARDLKERNPWVRVLMVVLALGYIASLVLGAVFFANPYDQHSHWKLIPALILAFWILVPPMWFVAEYLLLFRRNPATDTAETPAAKEKPTRPRGHGSHWLALS